MSFEISEVVNFRTGCSEVSDFIFTQLPRVTFLKQISHFIGEQKLLFQFWPCRNSENERLLIQKYLE